jgi:hypothetical protein
MVQSSRPSSPERAALLQWAARMGAVTAEALAAREGRSVASARALLIAAENAGLLVRNRPLAGQPALYAISRTGLARSGLRGLGSCNVSVVNALHSIACVEVAAALEHRYPDHRVLAERELRRDEREQGAPIASASLSGGARGQVLHRPDLVLWPLESGAGLPVAVEVELTVKAPRRLEQICRAWARCRLVAGVLYLAPPEVERALERAIAKQQASESIAVVPLDALMRADEAASRSIARTVPSGA